MVALLHSGLVDCGMKCPFMYEWALFWSRRSFFCGESTDAKSYIAISQRINFYLQNYLD